MAEKPKPLYWLQIYKKSKGGALPAPSSKPFVLATADIVKEKFSWLQRKPARESLQAVCREMVNRCPLNKSQTIPHPALPLSVHVHSRHDGLAGAVVAENSFNQRVSFDMLLRAIRQYDANTKGGWKQYSADKTDVVPWLQKMLEAYQEPEKVDKILRVQKNLDETKVVMKDNIEKVILRGDHLDDLLAKADDMSASSKVFYKKSKKMNKCCKSL